VTEEQLASILRDTATAVRAALERFSGAGMSGIRPGQYELDLAADQAACEVLRSSSLAVFSEESGHSGQGEILVVVDPVDGSTNADRGIPFFCVSLCAMDADGPLVSLVESLPTGAIYEATRGRGATRDSMPISTSGMAVELDAVVGVNGVLVERHSWAQVRTMGAAALELCLVADGSLDAYVQVGGAAIHPWDYLAGMHIALEAGGAARSQDDEELVIRRAEPRRPIVAATASLADSLLSTLTA